jgi:ATP-dependent Zn protease
MTETAVHCQRPLWKRPPFWFVVIAAVLALGIGIAMEESARRAPMPYGTFLDQVEAGNIASVTFRGTQIDGSLKHALGDAASNGATQRNTFRSHVPDFGDPTLLAELRKQHVVIDVASSSSWTRLLAGLPWPMLLFLGFIVVAGIFRFMRGGKVQSDSAMPMHPMQGMIGLISGLFGKQKQAAPPPTHDGQAVSPRRGAKGGGLRGR